MKTSSLLLASFLAIAAGAEEPREWLVVGPVKGKGRSLVSADAIGEMMFGAESPRYPKKGDKLGDLEWKAMTANAEGYIEAEELAPGAAMTVVTSDSDRVAILRCPGAGTVYVNGVAFAADLYSSGVEGVPVFLRKGENRILCRAGRGVLGLFASDPPAPVYIADKDETLPWRMFGVNQGTWGAAPIVNATHEWVRGATLEYGKVRAPLPPLPPLSVYKAPFLVGQGEEVTLRVVFGKSTHSRTWKLFTPEKPGGFQRTFRSKIDRSVQSFGELRPANFDSKREVALVLSLHGAGVGADGQSRSYAAQDWFALVAPTNRRPFGFNWEEWGRLDGLEVLEQGKKDFKVDESRIYLTGHSMGGHGAWHFAVTHPDRWAAVAPSAAWVSIWTYPAAGRDPAADYGRLFRASAAPSDTMALLRNLDGLPVFILHGLDDDVVPPAQADLMVEALKPFHKDWRYVPVEGKKHWWNALETPEVDCVQLPEMFDWMQARRRPDSLARWEFRTFSPAVSSSCRGVEILAQKRPYGLSRVKATEDDLGKRLFETENVVHLRVKSPREFMLDGEAMKSGEFHKGADGKWTTGAPAGLRKTPKLQGPFTQAFHTPFLLVTPTGGTESEIADAVARARFDAQVWWYRGNGRATVVTDAEVSAKDWKSLNLILYGSAESNGCWKRIADRLPFRASPGEITIGNDVLKGDLALTAVYPNPEVPAHLVAVIGASGAGGRRAWHAMGFWHPDTGSPDVMCWGADIHEKWLDSIRAVGHYGADWKPAEGMWEVKR
ncbi:MAG: prolyl oligopeptidase family serine peptidase [Planctomycetota bacterium]